MFTKGIEMNRPLSQRIHRIGTSGAFGIWEKAMAIEAQGKKIIHLEIGEPDFDTPAHIIETAHQSMLNGRTHYGSPYGEMHLRETVAEYIERDEKNGRFTTEHYHYARC